MCIPLPLIVAGATVVVVLIVIGAFLVLLANQMGNL